MVTIAVVGAGIKGAAVASLLSQAPGVSVAVHEAASGLVGATGSNHGRLHLGTAGWSTDSVELMRRRQEGSRLWRAAGIADGRRPGLYVFDDPEFRQRFENSCAQADIPYRDVRRVPIEWVDRWSSAVEVAEYGFNPAEAVARMRHVALGLGARWHVDSVVKGVAPLNSQLRLDTSSGSVVVDVVVNCAARWADQVYLAWRPDSLFNLDWFAWQIMVVRAADVPALNQVIVRVRPEGRNASVVPHDGYVTLDFKSDPHQIRPTPAPGQPPSLRLVNADDDFLATCVSAFPALATASSVYSFEGAQGRLRGAKPGSLAGFDVDPEVPSYLAAHGGQASTALLDALEVVEGLWARDMIDEDPRVMLGRFLRNLPSGRSVGRSRMSWEVDDG